MNRPAWLSQSNPAPRFDLAVVGGGATGLGVALHAAQRGFSVLLLEAHDFASATSSRSTKLLHGGVRYLAQGNLRLVREALHERSALMGMAPHLAQALAFVLPVYRSWQLPFYGLALKGYDHLSGDHALGATRFLNRRQTLEALPGVSEAGLVGGIEYWDGQFEDARYALFLAQSLASLGGVPVNHAKVIGVERSKIANSPRFVLQVRDQISGHESSVQADALVNATGVWVDALRTAAQPDTPSHLVVPSQGVHLVVDARFLPSKRALLVPRTRDGRVLFALPWLGSVVIGTTDTPRSELPLHPQPLPAEIDFLLTEASKALALKVLPSDVKSVWAGLRPLVANSSRYSTQSLSREHTVVPDPHGMVSVTGGKWTTYRVMAEDTLQACFEIGTLPYRAWLPPKAKSSAARDTAATSLTLPPGPHLYGEERHRLTGIEGHDTQLCLGLTEAMVRYAARFEWAMHVEDVLARRSRCLFLDAAQAQKWAPRVAEILQQETGIDPQLDAFMAVADRYRMP